MKNKYIHDTHDEELEPPTQEFIDWVSSFVASAKAGDMSRIKRLGLTNIDLDNLKGEIRDDIPDDESVRDMAVKHYRTNKSRQR